MAPSEHRSRLTRRRFVAGSVLLPAAAALGCGGGDSQVAGGRTGRPPPASGRTLPATPACEDGDEPTAAQTEGPFFTPDSPRRRSLLEPSMDGVGLVLTGTVLSTGCRPLAGTLLDFWQADATGEYDNEGYRLRGHQRADGGGRFRLETIVPAPYPGRTSHLHVRVQPRGGAALTTQLYFPGEPLNDDDGLFAEELVMALTGSGQSRRGRFDFVLDEA